jgi:uncharacterized protein YkwD
MKKIVAIIAILIVISGVVFAFRNDLLDFFSKVSLRLPTIEKKVTDFIENEIQKQVLTPPPLRYQQDDSEAVLTRAGVIQQTNAQRAKYNLPPLKENQELDYSAQLKVDDMFKNQYFAHESPSGIGVTDLAGEAGYDFLAIGENLALGNFKNDEVLVQAWMVSPGHRENILNSNYQEIGVSVKKATFEGKTTWLAVQYFGLSVSACPKPNETTKTTIDTNENRIKQLQNTIDALRVEIQNIRPKHGSSYQQKIDQYNDLVSQYNNLLEGTKSLIIKYNSEVSLFNNCVAGLKQ